MTTNPLRFSIFTVKFDAKFDKFVVGAVEFSTDVAYQTKYLKVVPASLLVWTALLTNDKQILNCFVSVPFENYFIYFCRTTKTCLM